LIHLFLLGCFLPCPRFIFGRLQNVTAEVMPHRFMFASAIFI